MPALFHKTGPLFALWILLSGYSPGLQNITRPKRTLSVGASERRRRRAARRPKVMVASKPNTGSKDSEWCVERVTYGCKNSGHRNTTHNSYTQPKKETSQQLAAPQDTFAPIFSTSTLKNMLVPYVSKWSHCSLHFKNKSWMSALLGNTIHSSKSADKA